MPIVFVRIFEWVVTKENYCMCEMGIGGEVSRDPHAYVTVAGQAKSSHCVHDVINLQRHELALWRRALNSFSNHSLCFKLP